MGWEYNKYISILLLSLLLFLPACGGKKDDNQALQPVQNKEALGQEESLESAAMGVMEGRTTGPLLPVYFAFDSSSISPDQKPRMNVNAQFLKDHETVTIRIEGNCDPKGTREYNLALGEKRALSARRYLVTLGVSSSRITTVSLGEEKMLLHGHDEMAWAQNRRDDFIIE